MWQRAIDPERPVLIAGPTASGKSALAAEIAERDGGVIVNADALQVYACWRVLTDRPSAREAARRPHRLYGHVPAATPYSVGAWLDEVAPLLACGARPIIVGGTGLYFTALTDGLAEIPPPSGAVRARATARLAEEGAEALLGELDASTRAAIDITNPARVRRAWEVLATTGQGLADWHRATSAPLLPLARAEALVVEADRARLAERIARRFDRMLAEGALDEVRAALDDWDPERPASKAIGARELVAHLRGEIDLDEARRRVTAATRRYVKRQQSWLKSRMTAWRPVAGP